ncbi:DUF5684 domain-containing protein [Mucilaginibacter sp.]|jgi:hypothetical protein|uniref:DUF5684 domain-containing protein n=1 Tax=Mucilaginibacter sp. TaxID=1882438 RepID=UPI002ED4A245
MENYPSSAPAFGIGAILFFVAIWLVCIAGVWKVFTKAGKPGWAAIIPIYNVIVLLEIVGKPIWWFLLILFPCTSFIFVIWTYNLLAKSFGKSEGFTVGLVLLNPIFMLILGFGDAVYLGPSAKEANINNRFGSDDYQKPFDPQA